MQEALRGEITKKMIVYFFHVFFLLQINVIALRFIFIIDHIKIISNSCFNAVFASLLFCVTFIQ